MAKAKSSRARASFKSGTTFTAPMTLVTATYLCTHGVPNCTTYIENLEYEILVADPPPPSITITKKGPCYGTILTLVS